MNSTVMDTPELLPRRFALILGGLRPVIAAAAGQDRRLVALVLLLWKRLARVEARFGVLVARVLAGHGGVRRVRPVQARAARPVDAARLPSGFAWLVKLIPWKAAPFGCQLEALLQEPAMLAVLQAEPGVGRLMRPLCRMLAVALPPALRLPPRVRAVAASVEAAPVVARRRTVRARARPSAVAQVAAAAAGFDPLRPGTWSRAPPGGVTG